MPENHLHLFQVSQAVIEKTSCAVSEYMESVLVWFPLNPCFVHCSIETVAHAATRKRRSVWFAENEISRSRVALMLAQHCDHHRMQRTCALAVLRFQVL